MSLTDSYEALVLNLLFRGVSVLPPAAVYLGLLSFAPTDSDAGTELSGNNYTRQAITFAAPSGGSITNSSDVVFGPATPGGWSDVVAVGVYSDVTGGSLIAYASITSATVNALDELKFAAGAVTISLD